MDFNELLADYFLGNKPNGQLPDIALKGVIEGIESESLLILAGMHERDNQHEIVHYFDLAMAELKIKKFTELECANILLIYYLKKIIDCKPRAFELMQKIHNDIYTNINFAKQTSKNSKYFGDALNLEKMYTWYRELQDWEDGSKLFYFNNLNRPDQRLKFIDELVKEAEILLNKLLSGSHYT